MTILLVLQLVFCSDVHLTPQHFQEVKRAVDIRKIRWAL